MKTATQLLLIGLSSAMMTGLAQGQVIFSDNFNSYAAGSNLNGQGGWTVDNSYISGNDIVRLSNSALLNNGSVVIDGRADGIENISFALHALPSALSTTAITTFTFDAYATTTSPATQNTGAGFGKTALPVKDNTFAYWGADSATPRWYFDARLVSNQSSVYSVTSSYNQVVHFGVVVDGPAGKIYGIYDLGLGYQQTPLYDIAAGTIASLDAVTFHIAYGSSGAGGEFDNFSVQAVPEPSTYALWGGIVALLGAGFKQWRYRKV